MQVKMLRGSSSNYPSAEPEDLHGPDIENRLEIIGLYRGHSCIPGVEYTQETRAKLLEKPSGGGIMTGTSQKDD